MKSKSGTKQGEIATMLESGMVAAEVYAAITPLVYDQVKPWIFTSNPPKGSGLRRTPKDMASQLQDLRYHINRIAARLGKEGIEEDGTPIPSPTIPDPVPAIPEKSDEKSFFLREVRRIRKWIANRGDDAIDEISMRPVVAAAKAIPLGIPAKALLAAMTMHWPKETKVAAGIEEYDFLALSARLAKSEKLPAEIDGKQLHRLTGYVVTLAKAGIPVMAIGPSGTGKSTLAKQVASLMEVSYGECPMTAGATPSWLLGSHTIDGFITRDFLEMYAKGVFNFEEIDASDPNMLLVANNALEQDGFHSPTNGEYYAKSSSFIPYATANTFGLGANRAHSARERLDAATIDRWRMGRVMMELDESLEENILGA